MKTHLPYSDKDKFSLKEIIKMWEKKGFIGELDLSKASDGVAIIFTDDWTAPKARSIYFHLHKIYAGSGIFGQKCLWVSELSTREKTGKIQPRGCVEGKNQLKTLDRAINQVSHGFPSQTKIEDYYFI